MKDVMDLLDKETKEEMLRKIEKEEIVESWIYSSAKKHILSARKPAFQVGDIVCRRIGNNWDCIPSTTTPKRFLISYIDEYGMMYAFKVCTRRNLGKVLHCITSDLTYTYELDPLYIECQLTGKNYMEVFNGLFGR